MRALSLLILPLLLSTGAALAKGKKPKPMFAYVDVQRAALETKEGKKIRAELEKMKKDRQTKLDAKMKELQELKKDFDAQQSFMKAEVKREKQMQLEKAFGELQMTYAKLQKELVAEEARRTKKVLMRMKKILATMGKKGDYGMIFDGAALVWAEPHLDLTNELIRRYNKGEGK